GDYPTATHTHGDPHCDPNGTQSDGNGGTYPTDAIPGYNVPAGQWFAAQFQQLVANAYPPIGGSSGDTTPPSAPSGVTVTGTTTSSVALSWTASTDNVGVTGYDIYRGTTLAGTSTTTSFTDSGLTASTQYSYTIKAHDAAGNLSTASTAVTATTQASSSGTSTCDPTGTIPAGDYMIQANEWNSTATQCITYTGGTAWNVSTANFNLTGSGAPATYPSIYKGCHWGLCTPNSGLPIQVSKLGSATSSWSTTQPASGAYDVAYDIWFNSTPTTTGQPDGTEMMIWLNSRGGVQPFGSQTATANVAGYNWNVWTGNQTSWKIISYVLNPGGTSFNNLDIKALINDAVSRGSLNASNYLIDSEVGFEIWQGGQGLATNSYSFNATAGGGGDTTPPSTPTNVVASGVTSSSVSLSWSPSTDNVGVTGYRIYRNGTQVGTATSTSYTDTGLTASTQYSYTVAAYDAAGNVSTPSSAVSTTTSAGAGDTTPPSTPTNVVASGVTSSSVSLSWSPSTDNVGVTGYRIYRNGTQVGTATSTSYTDTGLTASTQYSYTVAAYDAAGNVSTPSSAVSTTTSAGAGDTTPPSTPTNVVASGVTSSSVSLSWSPSTDNVGVTGYRIYRNGTQVGTATGTSYTDTGLTASTQYSYTVAAYDAAGNVSTPSSAVSTTTSAGNTGGGGCTATFQNTSDWGNGFTANVTVTNTGSTTTKSWKVTWTWGGNQQVTNMWNAANQQSGQGETATNMSYNGAIAPGANTQFGFQASYSGANANPTLTCTAS
ncbi:fibronectin type III domain-containing protein, partial [Actinocrinis puniceicyclus]